MRKFEIKNGDNGPKVFEAENASGIVDFMRKDSWSATQSDKEFLRKTAKLANMWSGDTFRYHNKEVFVEDLIASGMLREVTDGTSQ